MSTVVKEILENFLYRARFERRNHVKDIEHHDKTIEFAQEQKGRIKDLLDEMAENESAVYQAAIELGLQLELREDTND